VIFRVDNPDTQYNQCRAQWQLESVCPAQSFVTVDSDVARNPPLVILQTVSVHVRRKENNTAMIKFKMLKMNIFLMTILPLFISCNSGYNQEEKVDTSAYNSEVFEKQFIMFYGSWELQKIETGWGEIPPDFDYLDIKPFGTFSILRNDTIVANGKIEIINQDENLLNIRFEANNNITLNLLQDSEKRIIFKNGNLIEMIAPCCDRANYRLKRK